MKKRSARQHVSIALRLLQLSFQYLGPLFPAYFSKRAYRIWFTPQRFNTPERELLALQTARCSELVINHAPVKIYHWGEGPQILFVHGWSGRGSQVTHYIEKLVAAGFTVLSFDAPAHGASPGKQTNVLVVSEVIRILHQQFGDFHAAITHSFGGIALPYAIRHGVRVGRVVSICPADRIETALKNFQRQLKIPDAVMHLMETSMREKFGETTSEEISTVANVALLDIPGLVIHDENDVEIPWQCGKQVADAWPGCRFMLTHHLGHRRILRAPETVQAVVDFVTQQ